MSEHQSAADTFERARKVADAVLYEGYVLYPYRASSPKNQVRWQFGVVAPRDFAERDESEDWVMQTETVIEAGMDPALDLRLRFLRVQERQVQQAVGEDFEPVATLELDGTLVTTWDEAVEEELNVNRISVSSLLTQERVVPIDFAEAEDEEILRDSTGAVAGRIVRRCQALSGLIRMAAWAVEGPQPLVKVRVRVENVSPWTEWPATRDLVVRRSFAAVHTLAAVSDGRFISLADPPDYARAAVATCKNLHTWPVIVGEPPQRTVILSSPVTLSDYPEIAPESPGDMYDATEIDEILALRVMTLTEEEKREARSTDPRAAAIIDRCDILPPEIFERLHGAVRYLREAKPGITVSEPDDDEAENRFDPPDAIIAPFGVGADPFALPDELVLAPVEDAPAGGAAWWTPEAEAEVDPFEDRVRIGDIEIGRGSKCVMRPNHRADVHDMFLAGRAATVEAVFYDVDGNVQIAVSIDSDDPELQFQLGHGRFLYFHPDEIEPVGVTQP